MHELSIAHAIIGEVRDAAQRHGVGQVTAVTVSVGRLSGIVAGSLEFGWSIVRDGSEFAETELVIEELPVQVWCPEGNHTLVLNDMIFHCDEHDCATPDVLEGDRIEIVRFDTADIVDPEAVVST